MSEIENIEVIVDSREPQDTLERVQRFYKKARIEQLDIGDIAYKNIAFELKTMNDFAQSIMDKRFRNQLYNFYLNKEIDSYYFIYGKWSDINKHSQIKMTAVLGAIASIQGRYGLRLCIFPNKDYAIYCACKIIEKSFDHKEVRPITYKISTDERAISMLSASAERFQEKGIIGALQHFGSVKEIVNTTPKQLEKIKHIGEETVKRFFETINYNFKLKKEFEEEFDKDLELIDIEEDKIE